MTEAPSELKFYRLGIALFATALMVLYAALVMGHVSVCFELENGPGSLGLTWGYSPQDVYNFLSARSTEQIHCYLQFIQIWDTIFPLLYGFMHVAWLFYFFPRVKWLWLLPVVHILLDWSENFVESNLVQQYLETAGLSESWVSVGSMLTVGKWSMSMLVYAITLLGLILFLLRRFKVK